MPVIDAERHRAKTTGSALISRRARRVDTRLARRIFDTFDLPRNLADDTFNNQKATADGREFRTAPLMGLGRIGPPFLHDGRVYLSGRYDRGQQDRPAR